MTVKFGAEPLRTWSSPPPAAPIAGALFVMTAPDEFDIIVSGGMTASGAGVLCVRLYRCE
jgi:hypothetical protein